MKNPGFLCDKFIEQHNWLKKYVDKIIDHNFNKKHEPMTPTEEQIKEIEREALIAYPEKLTLLSYKSNKTTDLHRVDRERWIKGAIAQLEKFPCGPEEAREAIELLKTSQLSMWYKGRNLYVEIKTFLNKLK